MVLGLNRKALIHIRPLEGPKSYSIHGSNDALDLCQ
jgi:hypothetical protein